VGRYAEIVPFKRALTDLFEELYTFDDWTANGRICTNGIAKIKKPKAFPRQEPNIR